MRTLLLILFMPLIAMAGVESIFPGGDIDIQAGWTNSGCASSWQCLDSDPSDTADYIYEFDNSAENTWAKFSLTNTTTATDSTIDSTRIYMHAWVSNVGNTYSLWDSVAGQSSAIRQSSTITLSTADVAEKPYVTYTTNPDGGAWSWSNLDAYIVGVYSVNINNNQYLYVGDIWVQIYYHYTSAGGVTPSRRKRLMGE